MIATLLSLSRHIPTLTFIALSTWSFLLCAKDFRLFESLNKEHPDYYYGIVFLVSFLLVIYFVYVLRYLFLSPQTIRGERSFISYWNEAVKMQNTTLLEHLKIEKTKMAETNMYRLFASTFLLLSFVNFISEGTSYQFVQDHLFIACLLSFPIAFAFLIALMRNEGDETTIYIPSQRSLRVD